ncbi:MAG: PspC domain-containing protein [Mangrovibacterium sp.]
MGPQRKLFRSQNKMIAGICAGLGDFFNIDPTIVRLIFALCLIIGSFGGFSIGGFVLLAYIIAWIIIPEHYY